MLVSELGDSCFPVPLRAGGGLPAGSITTVWGPCPTGGQEGPLPLDLLGKGRWQQQAALQERAGAGVGCGAECSAALGTDPL